MITRRELVRALGRERRVADWVLIERTQELATIDQLRSVIRRENRTRIAVIVHSDTALGRGSAQIVVDASDGNASAVVAQGVALARATIGTAWKSVPPAAPAKVTVDDRTLPKDLTRAARDVLSSIRTDAIDVFPGERINPTVRARCSVLRERVEVLARSGFHDGWPATQLRVDALVAVGDRSLELVREARRPDDLQLSSAVTKAATDLWLLSIAPATPPAIPRDEPLDLVLETEAMLHGDALGVWSIFATQADSLLERQGLTRFRPGAPIVPGAAQAPEPLTISSEGAIDHALRSSPVSEDGDAIRNFMLVERGIASGLALTMREAALRGREPNGGVRNLVVPPGLWDGQVRRRTIVVNRLRALSIDPLTGEGSLEIALGTDVVADAGRNFSGGTVRLDLVAALARSRRRAAKDVQRGAYIGPPSLLIDNVELLS